MLAVTEKIAQFSFASGKAEFYEFELKRDPNEVSYEVVPYNRQFPSTCSKDLLTKWILDLLSN